MKDRPLFDYYGRTSSSVDGVLLGSTAFPELTDPQIELIQNEQSVLPEFAHQIQVIKIENAYARLAEQGISAAKALEALDLGRAIGVRSTEHRMEIRRVLRQNSQIQPPRTLRFQE